ncbi:hypothetical protein [Methanospirillum sp.]
MKASTNQNKTEGSNYKDPICPFSGIAMTTDGTAIHVTAQVAREERRYIIPAHAFNQFVFGGSGRGVNRDLLNEGQSEEAFSVQVAWENGIPYLQDCYYDPMGKDRVLFSPVTLGDLFTLSRHYIFLDGSEPIRLSWRLGHEIQCQMRKEIKYGTDAPARMPARYLNKEVSA